MPPILHSKLGASSAYRWFACPGSIALSEHAPPQIESKYASEGTKAHELAEALLIKKHESNALYPEDMINHVAVYVDEVLETLARLPGAQLMVEEKFTLSKIDKSMFGTNDSCIMDVANNELYVFDLKYGKGIEVHAENNKQLLYYALGASAGVWYDKYHLTIVQPRIAGEVIKTWTITDKELKAFQTELRKAVKATKEPNAKLCSGEHCRFCPCITICPEIKNEAQEIAKCDFKTDTINVPDVKTLELSQIATAVKFKKTLNTFLDACENRLFNELRNGVDVPGFKLVKKRKNRKWANEYLAKDMLLAEGLNETDILETKLLTVSKLEQLIGKNEFKGLECLLDNTESEITLALESDKRPPVQNAAKLDFDKVD